MALSKPKLLISFITLFFMMLVNKVHSQGATSFAIELFDPHPMALTYQGHSHVPSGSRFARLIKTDNSGSTPQSWSTGRVLYSCPVKLWEQESARQASFETTIRFYIRPSKNGAADGIVFFIAPVGSTIPQGSGGENFGVFGPSGFSPALFAVEFDTYVNSGWDPNYRHIGIDINNRNSKNVTRFERAVGREVTARITYSATTRQINVVASTSANNYEVSYYTDLKTILPERVQVGLSATTGQFVDELGIHDIRFWSFASSMEADIDNHKHKN